MWALAGVRQLRWQGSSGLESPLLFHPLQFLCCYICVDVCINTTCLVYLVLLTCDVFRVDHLRLDTLSGASSVEKTNFPSLISHQFHVALHLVVKPCKISLIHTGMPSDISLCTSCFSDHTVRFYGCNFPVVYKRYCLRLDILASGSFHHSPLL